MRCSALSASSTLTACIAWTCELVKKSDGVFKVKTNTLVYAHLSSFSHSQDHKAPQENMFRANRARQKTVALFKTNEDPAGFTVLKL